MKKLLCLLLVALLLCLPGTLTVAAAGTMTASASQNTVTVGKEVTVTLKYDGGGSGIGSLDATFHYNAKTFEYVSCTGANANGAAGVVTISYFATEAVAPKSLTITLKLKAIAAGSGDFSLTTGGMYDDEDNLLGTPSKSLSVSASNPTLSGDATLSALKPSKGTLTPKFSSKTTEYTITVENSVTSLTLSATTNHPDAKTAISGKNALSVGKNTRVITVTAPNGTTKKYTVIITRAAPKNTTTGSRPTSTTATTTQVPQPDALEVTVGGDLMTVGETQPDVTLPTGFKWDYVALNGVDVSAAKNPTTGMVLLYLTNEAKKTSAFFIYESATGQFAPFRPMAVPAAQFVLLDMPAGQERPDGTVATSFTYEEGSVTAFAYEGTDLADYTLLYATAPDGNTGLYVYDRKDGSMQRYYRQPAAEAEDALQSQQPDDPKPDSAFVTFITRYRTVILVVAAACCGLAILVVSVVVAVKHRPARNRGKH